MSKSGVIFRQEPPLNLALQDLHIKQRWPTFRRVSNAKDPTWRGVLQPTEVSGQYTVVVTYRLGSIPKVRVESPKLAPGTPHLYPDGSLCLYYPGEWSWHGRLIIAETIIPWAAHWLFYYELWLDTGKWHGPEAPHDGAKRAI